MTEASPGIKIIPFRGEYYKLTSDRVHLVKNLIYPVPNPEFPFLGVHFTRKIDGTVEAGPNAVLAFSREGYSKTDINLNDLFDMVGYPAFWKLGKRYWKIGTTEMLRSYLKVLFVKALRKLIPEIESDDLIHGGSGVRAQALTKNGKLLDDFFIVRNKKITHVLNAPSPAATSAFAIADHIVSVFES
jgi:L-2-hydroxyglutarate oxidase